MATATFIDKGSSQVSVETLTFPTDYLVDSDWESKAKKREEDLSKERSSYGDNW